MKSRKTVNNTGAGGRLSAPSGVRSELEEAVMSFPLDHLYACSSEQARTLRPAPSSDQNLSDRLNRFMKENKSLKELLLVNLDLVQQQSDRIVAKDKALAASKREIVLLKARFERFSRRPAVSRPSLNPPPLVHIPPPPPKPAPATSQVALNKYTELLITDIGPKATGAAEPAANKSQSLCYFPTEGEYLHLPEVNVEALLKETQNDANKSPFNFSKETEYLQLSDINMTSILKDDDPEISSAKGSGMSADEDKKSSSSMKKDSARQANKTLPSSTGSRSAVSKHSRNEKNKSQFYKSRNSQSKVEPADAEQSHDIGKQFDYNFTVNKKSKMIHTYGKSSKKSSIKRLPPYTGSLSDRLKLIDTTPTGEDPYQLGELDLREQSPIPKLMLQKSTNKAKLFSGENFTTTSDSLNNLFGTTEKGSDGAGKGTTKIKSNKYNLGTPGYTYPGEHDDESTDVSENSEAAGDSEKPLGDLAWPDFGGKEDNVEVSCSDFSYGEKTRNLGSRLTFENDDYQNLFSSDSNFCPSDVLTEDIDVSLNDENAAGKEPKKKNESSRSLLKPKLYGGSGSRKYVPLRERMKRTLSTGSAHSSKWGSASKVSLDSKGENRVVKRRASEAPALAAGGGVSKPPPPPPPMMADRPYYTTCGETDCAWYAGRDPDSDVEDEPLGATSGSQYLEVPRWREKPYTSLYSLEGTENLDDEVFNKRHHKREVDERRRKRWDIQRIREQLTVERLRQKQPDAPWYDRSSRRRSCSDGDEPPLHTLWPPARRSIRFLEITESVPVSAFGDIIPALPERDFVLPWILNTRPFKRTKYLKKPQACEPTDKVFL